MATTPIKYAPKYAAAATHAHAAYVAPAYTQHHTAVHAAPTYAHAAPVYAHHAAPTYAHAAPVYAHAAPVHAVHAAPAVALAHPQKVVKAVHPEPYDARKKEYNIELATI